MYTLINTSGEKEYHEAVLRFLDELEDRNVTSVALVAVCDDGHDVGWFNSGALELKQMAGILDLAAVRQMIEEDGGVNDEE